jgi:hypothetical protein
MKPIWVMGRSSVRSSSVHSSFGGPAAREIRWANLEPRLDRAGAVKPPIETKAIEPSPAESDGAGAVRAE